MSTKQQTAIEPHDLARKVALLAEDKKAADILVLDVSSLTTVTEAFVICTGGSEPQLAAITESIVNGMAEDGDHPSASSSRCSLALDRLGLRKRDRAHLHAAGA